MKIGVIGHEGRLGTALIQIGAIPLPCDITNKLSIRDAIMHIHPEVIINCAAVTNVDKCEKEWNDWSIQLSIRGVQNLLLEAGNIPLIHMSSDFVFDGKRGPYKESAKPNPINSYGMAKYASELLFLTSENVFTIVRTTQLYGSVHEDFGNSIVKSLITNQSMKMFSDIYGNPTHVDHLAKGLMYLCNAYANDTKWRHPRILNIAGLDNRSRYDFAVEVAEILGADASLVEPVLFEDIAKVTEMANRPKHGGFDLSLADSFGVPLFHSEDGIKLMLSHYGYTA